MAITLSVGSCVGSGVGGDVWCGLGAAVGSSVGTGVGANIGTGVGAVVGDDVAGASQTCMAAIGARHHDESCDRLRASTTSRSNLTVTWA